MVALVFLIFLCLVYDFFNGYNDSGSIVATIVSTRALAPRVALSLTAVAEFTGPFLFGVAVAQTIGAGIVSPEAITINVVVAALISAISWGIFTSIFGIPSSSSHALIGGLIGSVGVSIGFNAIHLSGLTILLVALFVSPIISLFVGYLFTRLVYFLARKSTLRINQFFKNAQIVTGVTLALSHGTNDAQKTMAMITLSLIATGYLHEFRVLPWVVAISAGGIALGTSAGGWRMIRTVGGKFYRIRPVHGFSTQVSSAVVILSAALLGGPVSTSQVISSALLGVGAADRKSMVRWGVAANIVVAWLLTIPVTALLAALVNYLIGLIF